jgi:type I restriction enzyme S subunit
LTDEQTTLEEESSISNEKEQREVSLDEICSFMMRGKHPDYVDESRVRVLNQKAVRWGKIEEKNLKHHNPETQMAENRFIKQDDIVINSTGVGTLGRVYYFREKPDKMFADSHITILRVNKNKVLPEYLYYVLKSSEYQERIKNIAVGSTGQIELNKRELKELKLVLPSLEKQRVIVDKISPIERKISTNRNIIKNVSEITKNLFKSEFRDYRGYENFRSTENGQIPNEFELTNLSEIASIDHERIEPGEEPEEIYSYYSFSAYDEKGRPVLEDAKEINSAKYKVEDKTILVSKLNPRINRIWKVTESEENAISSTEFVHLRPNNDGTFYFLYSLLDSEEFQKYLESFTTGTSGSHQRVKQKDILGYKVALHQKTKFAATIIL